MLSSLDETKLLGGLFPVFIFEKSYEMAFQRAVKITKIKNCKGFLLPDVVYILF